MVLSHGHWMRDYGGDRAVVGRPVRISGQRFTVVGVASAAFTGPGVGQSFDLWAPLSAQPALLSRMSTGVMRDRAAGWLQLFGRLDDGATVARAGLELQDNRRPAGGHLPDEPGPKRRRRAPASASTRLIALRLHAPSGCSRSPSARDARRLRQRCRPAARPRPHPRAGDRGAHGDRRDEGASRPAALVEGLVLAGIAGVIGVSLASMLAGAAATLQPRGLGPPRRDDRARHADGARRPRGHDRQRAAVRRASGASRVEPGAGHGPSRRGDQQYAPSHGAAPAHQCAGGVSRSPSSSRPRSSPCP